MTLNAAAMFVVAAAAAAATTAAAAANATADPRNRCARNIGSWAADAPVNATGKQKFRLGPDDDNNNQDYYYLSVTLNDTRHESNDLVTYTPEVLHDLQAWFSAPEDVAQGFVCVYQLKGVNASSPEGERNGCDGVLSEECMAELESLAFAANGNGGNGNQTRCEPGNRVRDVVRNKCAGNLLSLFTSYPIDLSNRTCTIPSPQGVSTPDDYLTHAATGIGVAPGQSDAFASFEWYDLYVRQTIPFVVASWTPGRGSVGSVDVRGKDTQVVCVAPDTVLPGSRQPDLRFGTMDEESAARRLGCGVGSRIMVAVAVGVSLLAWL